MREARRERTALEAGAGGADAAGAEAISRNLPETTWERPESDTSPARAVSDTRCGYKITDMEI